MKYNWKALTNNDIAGLIRNGGIVSGYDADFNRELVEETARRIEHAAQLEAKRDEWKEAHSQACRLLDTVQEQRDEARAKLSDLQSLYAGVTMALFGIDKEVFGPLTAREGVAELNRQRDEARAKLALVKAEAEYWFTQYKLATSNTVPMEAIP